MDRIKSFWKDNRVYIVIFFITVVVFNIRLPYYVSAPGGTIDITNRLSGEDSKKINGSLNLLYVTEFEGTVRDGSYEFFVSGLGFGGKEGSGAGW